MRPLYDWLSGNKYHETSGEIPRNNADSRLSLSGRRNPTASQEATYIDTWPLRTPADFSSAYVSLEMNPIQKT